MAQAKRQQNFRLPVPLIGRLEGVCGKGRRFRDKSAAVEEALDRMLGAVEASFPEEPSKWATVANPAGEGTLVRILDADPEAWFAGALALSRAGEKLRVRDVDASGDGLLLTVDRGCGTGLVFEIAAGDELCQVGQVDSLEASPAADDPSALGVGAGSSLSSAPADGAEREGGCDTSAVPPWIGAEGGQGAALSVPEPPDSLQGPTTMADVVAAQDEKNRVVAEEIESKRAPFPVGRAELMEGRADSDGDRSAAAQEAESVDVAVWLAERTGAPVAVCRRRISEGRVTISGDGFDPPGEHFDGPFVAKSRLDQLELDGERV